MSRCNTHGNGQSGISASSGSNISDCVSSYNSHNGITMAGGIVRGNVCDGNPDVNIYISSEGGAIVRNNTCSNSIGVGIQCDGPSSHVEANVLNSNVTGLYVSQNRHTLVVRNYAYGNTFSNYNIQSGNNWAGILNIPGEGFASTNSWANIAGD